MNNNKEIEELLKEVHGLLITIIILLLGIFGFIVFLMKEFQPVFIERENTNFRRDSLLIVNSKKLVHYQQEILKELNINSNISKNKE